MNRKTSFVPQARRLAAGIGCIGAVFITGIALAAPRYVDLRQVAPVHGDPAAGEKKAAVCFACHGPNGAAPIAPTFPRLAGQREGYLYHRLLSFKHASPKDPYYSVSAMTPNVAPLNDTDMRNLAAYFASQNPTAPASATAAPAAAAPAPGSKGEVLFKSGDPAHGVPPCQGCHGADALGPPVSTGQYALWPSLRGQSGMYVAARLTSFHKHEPNDTTNDFIMGGVAQTLDDDSIQAIATWLSSLTPAKSL